MQNRFIGSVPDGGAVSVADMVAKRFNDAFVGGRKFKSDFKSGNPGERC